MTLPRSYSGPREIRIGFLAPSPKKSFFFFCAMPKKKKKKKKILAQLEGIGWENRFEFSGPDCIGFAFINIMYDVRCFLWCFRAVADPEGPVLKSEILATRTISPTGFFNALYCVSAQHELKTFVSVKKTFNFFLSISHKISHKTSVFCVRLCVLCGYRIATCCFLCVWMRP